MNSFKIAYKLLKNNMSIYGFYLVVLVITVVTYYNFAALQYNDKFVELAKHLQTAMIPSLTCGFVLICTVVFFMWHANGFFFKQRQKEIGVYMLAGVSSSKIGRVYAIESILLGGLSLLIGLPVGILLSKLFLMLLGKSMLVEGQLPFTVSLNAIIQLMVVFGVIFLFLGIKNYRTIKKSQLISMVNAVKQRNTLPKLNYFKGVLGILLILTGYISGLNLKCWDLDLLGSSMTAVVAVCTGTYLIFGSLLTILFSKLSKNKKFVYKNSRLVSVSNIFFRLKGNYRSYAMTAILVASTVTALSVSMSFKQYMDNHVMIEAPYSFSYESNYKSTKDKVIGVIENSSHRLIGINEVQFCVTDIEYLNKNKKVQFSKAAIVTSYSQIKKTLEYLKYENRGSVLKRLKPKENEVVLISEASTIAPPLALKNTQIRINGKDYFIKEGTQVPFIGNVPGLGSKKTYILNDDEYIRICANLSPITLNGFNVTEPENTAELIADISNIFPEEAKKVNPYLNQYIWEYYAMGIFYFLGLIMSLVFMLATLSTIYFKLLSEAFMDREQYTMLRKIGMSKEEVQKSVYVQMGIAFLLPVIIGIIHSIIAMKMLEKILNMVFTFQSLCSIGVFATIMLMFYVVISKKYTEMVYEK